MKLIVCDFEDVFIRKRNWNILKILEWFADGDMECVKIEYGDHYVNPISCYSSFRKAIKRYNKTGIMVIMSEYDVYLVKCNGEAPEICVLKGGNLL